MKITREAMSERERAKLGRNLGGAGTPPVAASAPPFHLATLIVGALVVVLGAADHVPWFAALGAVGVGIGAYNLGRASSVGAGELRPVLAREQARVGELVSVLVALGLRADDGAAGRGQRAPAPAPRTEPRPSASLDLPGERNGGHAYGAVAPGDADPLDSTGAFGQ